MSDDRDADPPTLPEKAAGLARAVVRFVAGGMTRATPEEAARRLSICGKCPQFTGGKCRFCACRMAIKVRMPAEHCPIGKW